MPPQVNARLIEVREATAAARGRDDWDSPDAEPAPAGGHPAVKWTAPIAPDLNAYLREGVLKRVEGGELNVTATRTLYVDSTVARAAGIDTNDVLVIRTAGGETIRATAAVVAIRELPGVPPGLQTARLELAA